MKKGLFLAILLISFTMSTYADTLVGGKLKVAFETIEESFFNRRQLKMTVQNVYTKYGGYIWVEHVVDDIYDIKRDEGGPFGYEAIIGTADLYSHDFLSIISKFFAQRSQKDESIWQEQSNTLAKMYFDYIKFDHE
jgi:hypothetical protein